MYNNGTNCKTEVQLFIGSMECKVPREELMTVDDVDFLKITCLLDSYADFYKIE